MYVPSENLYNTHYVPRFSVSDSLNKMVENIRKGNLVSEIKKKKKTKYVCVIDTTVTFIQIAPKLFVAKTESYLSLELGF